MAEHPELFDLEQARRLLPSVLERAAEIIVLRADLAEAQLHLRQGNGGTSPALADAKAMEARLHEHVEWFTDQGLQVKGIAPLLLDFPSTLAGTPTLLCWLEGETELAWCHPWELGFMGRRRLG